MCPDTDGPTGSPPLARRPPDDVPSASVRASILSASARVERALTAVPSEGTAAEELRVARQALREAAEQTSVQRPRVKRGEDATTTLEALADPECRAILAATACEAKTVAEIETACDIPASTAYRKLETLQTAGLVTTDLRIGTDGPHATEYSCAVRDVTATVGGDPKVTLWPRGAHKGQPDADEATQGPTQLLPPRRAESDQPDLDIGSQTD